MVAEGNAPDDLPAHAKSYSMFTWMMKWGTIVSFILALLVVIIIKA
jgi:hypothetical protein